MAAKQARGLAREAELLTSASTAGEMLTLQLRLLASIALDVEAIRDHLEPKDEA